MSEYIEKQEILWRMTNSLDEQELYLPIHFKELVLDEIEPADVVERSKIDKAIEEISEYASIWTSYTMDMSKEQIAVRCLNDYATQFLDILKRNIGEQNN